MQKYVHWIISLFIWQGRCRGLADKASMQFSQKWIQIIICVDIHPYFMAFGLLRHKKQATCSVRQFKFIWVSYDFFNEATLWSLSNSQVISSCDILSSIFHLHRVDRFLRKSSSQCNVNKFDQTRPSLALEVWPEHNFVILHHMELTLSTKVLNLSLSTTLMLSEKASLEWKRSTEAQTFQAI